MSIQELKQASKTIWNDIKVAKSILKHTVIYQQDGLNFFQKN